MRVYQPVANAIEKSILTTQGDIVVRGATDPQRLAAGAANTVLTAQGAGALPIYEDPHKVLTTQGDILIRGATAAERLAIGTAGFVLESNGAGANPSWKDIFDILTTQGDILIRGAAGAERLGIQATGKVLTSNGPGANPSWEDGVNLLTTVGQILHHNGFGPSALNTGALGQALMSQGAGNPLTWAFPTSFLDPNANGWFSLYHFEIGTWNMDSTATVYVNHGLNMDNILFVNAIVRDDANTYRRPLDYHHPTLNYGAIRISSTQFELERHAAGVFDSTDYDSTAFNRGNIFCGALV